MSFISVPGMHEVPLKATAADNKTFQPVGAHFDARN